MTKPHHPATLAAQALGWVDEATRAVVPPIHTSTTYIRDEDNQYRSGRIYARADNPAFDQPEALLTALEQGEAAMLFSSGMAAATACFMALAPGDHVVVPRVIYWGLRNWLLNFATNWGLRVTFVDMSNKQELEDALLAGETKLIWIETPANPTWTITDISHAAACAKRIGAKLAVDSTVATPIHCQPLLLGADIVMHAATKYLNGHSDLIAGALVTRENDAYWQKLKVIRSQLGSTLGSFEAWLLLRGMRTLSIRVLAATKSADAIAKHFEHHPKIRAVLYPGLSSFVGHETAKQQMQNGFGGMLSLCIKGSDEADGETRAIAVAANTKIFKRATSLGGVESLIEHRASVEGAGTPAPRDMLRISIGIEHTADLIADLEAALEVAFAA
jgi:cystathionine gamma-synthase